MFSALAWEIGIVKCAAHDVLILLPRNLAAGLYGLDFWGMGGQVVDQSIMAAKAVPSPAHVEVVVEGV